MPFELSHKAVILSEAPRKLSHKAGFIARSRRTSAMLVGRCSSEFSGHKLHSKQKSHKLRGSRGICSSADLSWKCFSTERTRISCRAVLDSATCAAFVKESRIKIANVTKLNRKSGVAEWRDLRFLFGSPQIPNARRLQPSQPSQRGELGQPR
jgi:hypothetical protein